MTQFKIGKIDLSQIECRILNTVAGQWDVVEKFRQGKDLYSELASEFYGFPVDKSMPAERGTGKQLELSCLGPDTLVLTNRGTKPITAVTTNDRLWDGIKWVEHRGLVDRGKRDVIRVLGNLWVTPEHLFLCGSTWQPAQALHGLLSESMRLLALATGSASLPSPDTWLRTWAACEPTSYSAAAARLNIGLTRGTPTEALRRAAMRVLRKLPGTGRRNITDMPTSWPTMPTADDFWAAYQQSLTAAKTLKMQGGETTGGEVSSAFGSAIGAPSLPMWPSSPEPLIRSLNLIASELMATTNRETCASSLTNAIRKIAARLRCSKPRMQTYDLSYAGSRNRFAVKTSKGWVIVHNCGYGAGGPTIVRTARAGTYGPPVYLTDEQGMAARDLYRGTHKAVVKLWATGDAFLWHLMHGTTIEWPGCPVTAHDHRLFGPGGLWLDFTSLERHTTEEGEVIWRHRVKNGYRKTYGARLIENLIQWLARMVISQAMVTIHHETGLKIPLTVHDDVFTLVPVERVDLFEQAVAIMQRPLAWLPECPIGVEAKLLEALDE